MHEPQAKARELETHCRADAPCRPLHIIKLPPIEAVNALSEQVSASAAARKNEEDSDDDL
jgi:hypothetical protein